MQESRDAPAWRLARQPQDAQPKAACLPGQQGVRRGRVPQVRVELVLRRQGWKAQPQVSPLQEQQAWRPEVL